MLFAASLSKTGSVVGAVGTVLEAALAERAGFEPAQDRAENPVYLGSRSAEVGWKWRIGPRIGPQKATTQGLRPDRVATARNLIDLRVRTTVRNAFRDTESPPMDVIAIRLNAVSVTPRTLRPSHRNPRYATVTTAIIPDA
jgi:hypothetical protein